MTIVDSELGGIPAGLPQIASRGLLPGALTHKTSLAEVLLVHVNQAGPDTADITLQWPRAHYFYRTDSERADTLLLAESMRQITVAVGHLLCGVKPEQKFVLSELRTANTTAIPGFSPHMPSTIQCRVQIGSQQSPSGRPTALQVDAEFSVEGQAFAAATLDSRLILPGVYRRLRQNAYSQPSKAPYHRLQLGLLPPPVSRPHRRDRAVIKTGNSHWALTPDTSHPLLFDHPIDHISGMFVVEALRQAMSESYPADDPEPTGLHIRYLRMIELDETCSLQFNRFRQGSAESSLRFEFRQAGLLAAEGTLYRSEGA